MAEKIETMESLFDELGVLLELNKPAKEIYEKLSKRFDEEAKKFNIILNGRDRYVVYLVRSCVEDVGGYSCIAYVQSGHKYFIDENKAKTYRDKLRKKYDATSIYDVCLKTIKFEG